MLQVLVLGSAAGGGFPQWNCNCTLCRRARAGDPKVKRRTQSSLAVSSGDGKWFLLNASPDLRKQIDENADLHPDEKHTRHSPIAGAVLTNADVDHIAGLLNLRESQPLAVYATRRVHAVLDRNSVYGVLNPAYVERRTLDLERRTELAGKDGVVNGIAVEPFAVPGKIALYLEDTSRANMGSTPEDTIALKVTERAGGKSFYYVPACASMPPELAKRLSGADLVFFDGTVWQDDEMIATRTGKKTGGRMGHMHLSGDDGSVAAFASLGVKRKVYVHINNTNPVLAEDSAERRFVESAGWEVGYDGMKVTL
jgi:pyrroloquinoline quinone biosynthesis protein B